MIELTEQFKKDWVHEREIAQVCLQLFEFLSTSENWLEHFNFTQLKVASDAVDDAKLTKALQYLSSPRCELLSQVFLYFDHDDVFEFSSLDMIEFYSAAYFAHPKTGEIIQDLNEIAVAFEPGRRLRQMVSQ